MWHAKLFEVVFLCKVQTSHFQAHPRCLASSSPVAAVGRCACAIPHAGSVASLPPQSICRRRVWRCVPPRQNCVLVQLIFRSGRLRGWAKSIVWTRSLGRRRRWHWLVRPVSWRRLRMACCTISLSNVSRGTKSSIRSSNQDDTDGTSSIVLPCPSS